MKKISDFFLSENVQFLEVKFSIYLNSNVFVMFSWTITSILMESGVSGILLFSPSRIYTHYENTPIQIY